MELLVYINSSNFCAKVYTLIDVINFSTNLIYCDRLNPMQYIVDNMQVVFINKFILR